MPRAFARVSFVPWPQVHYTPRPCRLADAGVGELRTWRPVDVTCSECAPAARWIGRNGLAAAFAVGLGSLVFCLALL